jgi:hypothetical protein
MAKKITFRGYKFKPGTSYWISLYMYRESLYFTVVKRVGKTIEWKITDKNKNTIRSGANVVRMFKGGTEYIKPRNFVGIIAMPLVTVKENK